jgi:hypothetical protein
MNRQDAKSAKEEKKEAKQRLLLTQRPATISVLS